MRRRARTLATAPRPIARGANDALPEPVPGEDEHADALTEPSASQELPVHEAEPLAVAWMFSSAASSSMQFWRLSPVSTN